MTETEIPTCNLRVLKIIGDYGERAVVQQMFHVNGQEEWRTLPVVVEDRRTKGLSSSKWFMKKLGLS